VKETKPLFDNILEKVIPPSAKVILGYDVWDIDKRLIIVICAVFYGLFLGFGLYIGVSQYESIVKQKFISLDASSGDCVEVPRPLNSVYQADDVGYWSTNIKFKYHKSLYLARANSLQMTQDDWTTAMGAIKDQLKQVTDKGKRRDFSWNMVMWSSYSSLIQAPDAEDAKGNVIPGGSLQFYPNADAGAVLGDRDIISVNFGNKNGICAPVSKTSASFDTGSNSFIISFLVCDNGPCPYQTEDFCVDPKDITSTKIKNIFYPSVKSPYQHYHQHHHHHFY